MKTNYCLVLLLLVCIAVSPAWGTTYYVDQYNSGNFKTISQVNAFSFKSGDSILFKRGQEWGETLIVKSSYLTIGAYGSGADPVINGSGRSYCVDTNSNDYLNINYLELKNAKSDAIDCYGSNNLQITYCYIHDNYGKAARLSGGNNTIDHCNIYHNGSYGLIWSGNNNVISNNPISYNGWRTDNSYVSGINGQDNGTKIYGNTVHDNAKGGKLNYAHEIYVDVGATNTDIYDNIVYNSTKGTGIYHKGSGNIYANTCYNNFAGGIEVGFNSGNSVNMNIYYNITYDNTYGILERSKGSGTYNLNLYNNTSYKNNYNSGDANYEIRIENKLTSLTMKNNILYADDNDYAVAIAYQSSFVKSNNSYYRETGTNFIIYGGKQYTVASWSESGKLGTNPLLTAPDSGNFNLKSGSPCDSSGVYVGLSQDIYGNPVDRHHHEEQSRVVRPSRVGVGLGRRPNFLFPTPLL